MALSAASGGATLASSPHPNGRGGASSGCGYETGGLVVNKSAGLGPSLLSASYHDTVEGSDLDSPYNIDVYVRNLMPQLPKLIPSLLMYCDSETNACTGRCKEAKLGEGSYGAVYRMKYKNGFVAVKQARHRPEDLLREVRVLCNLERHPNVIHIKGMVTEGGRCWVVLPIARASLDYVIDEEVRNGAADPRFLKFARRVLQILLGVEHLQKGSKTGQIIVHRDIKPGNILQFLRANEIIVLADFGLASISDNTATGKGWQGGTRAYQSPEQRNRNDTIGPQSDVFSVGATMYHMLTGKPPPQVEERQPLPRVEHAPPAIQRLVAECCAFDPKSRPDIQTCIHQVRRFVRLQETDPPFNHGGNTFNRSGEWLIASLGDIPGRHSPFPGDGARLSIEQESPSRHLSSALLEVRESFDVKAELI